MKILLLIYSFNISKLENIFTYTKLRIIKILENVALLYLV